VLGQGDGEVPGLALDALDFTVGDQMDIDVPADLDQFG
jgi:hypothetical protein